MAREYAPIFKEEDLGSVDEFCPECGCDKIILDADSGESVCSECGVVLSEICVDTGPEWRSFTLEEDRKKSRVGLPSYTKLYDIGTSSTFMPNDKDFSGENISEEERWKIFRMKKHDERAKWGSAEKRSLSEARWLLSSVSDKMSLPGHVMKRGMQIYKEALDKDLTKGRGREEIALASLYASCREHEITRTLGYMERVCKVTKKKIARLYRLLLQELDIDPRVDSIDRNFSHVYSELGLPGYMERRGRKFSDYIHKLKTMQGKNPDSVGASVTYIQILVEGYNITQETVGEYFGVTPVTIGLRYKEITERLGLDSTKVWSNEMKNIINELESKEMAYDELNQKIELSSFTSLDHCLEVLEDVDFVNRGPDGLYSLNSDIVRR